MEKTASWRKNTVTYIVQENVAIATPKRIIAWEPFVCQ